MKKMMRMRKNCVIFFMLLAFLFGIKNTYAQKKDYKAACIAFYNLENLFDVIDDEGVKDWEFTPEGRNKWTIERYNSKLERMAKVISEIGTELTPDGPAVLGVAEIENRGVLEDLVKTGALKSKGYEIVHYDSPDKRGIDVAMLYQPKYFKVTSSRAVPLMLTGDDGERLYTRDQLVVSGIFDGEPMHFIMNHWPSRRGGEKRSRHLSNAAADLCKSIADSILAKNSEAKIIIMGDLNDDPVSPSLKKHLNSKIFNELLIISNSKH